MISHEARRFLFAGGTAALFNWVMRILLSRALPLGSATILAYLLGMALGFLLYRSFVFTEANGRIGTQVAAFILVNAASAVLVVGVTVGLSSVLEHVLAMRALDEALAHGTAIALGAVSNFVGHRTITFTKAPVFQSR